jgi:hypothetical protein
MESLGNKTKEQLIEIKSDYIKKYIGDFDKPIGYKQEIVNLTRLINSKG